jgi:hypothetical protein
MVDLGSCTSRARSHRDTRWATGGNGQNFTDRAPERFLLTVGYVPHLCAAGVGGWSLFLSTTSTSHQLVKIRAVDEVSQISRRRWRDRPQYRAVDCMRVRGLPQVRVCE